MSRPPHPSRTVYAQQRAVETYRSGGARNSREVATLDAMLREVAATYGVPTPNIGTRAPKPPFLSGAGQDRLNVWPDLLETAPTRQTMSAWRRLRTGDTAGYLLLAFSAVLCWALWLAAVVLVLTGMSLYLLVRFAVRMVRARRARHVEQAAARSAAASAWHRDLVASAPAWAIWALDEELPATAWAWLLLADEHTDTKAAADA